MKRIFGVKPEPEDALVSQTTTCVCGGEGKIRIVDVHGKTQEGPCPACNGTGRRKNCIIRK